MIETTVDKLLNARFEVEQPAKGYRIAVDTLLLASAVPACARERVCEFGCGVGGVMLALAARCPDVEICGLELQPEMAALCRSNILRNQFDDRLSVQVGDVGALPTSWEKGFDHVMMNPPYHDHKTHSVSANNAKRLAHAESDAADLGVWMAQGARCLRDGGTLSMIHRADRLDEIISLARRDFHRIFVKPVIARTGAVAKRIILRAKCGGVAGVSTAEPLILYGDNNRYSAAAEFILREAQAMPFQ